MSAQPAATGLDRATAVASAMRDAVTATVRGDPEVVRLALVTVLSGGHLLVEGLPGTGKTLLAKSLATAMGGHFRRVQCTPDLLPSDVTGTSVYRPSDGDWEFRPGPVFANVLLLDEVNRASPRTQAALLEPMEEHQVTVDGETRSLPEPFFCIATENPFGQAGTFPLPESQLDRFALVLSMAWPDRVAEREILMGTGGTEVFPSLHPVTDPAEVVAVAAAVRSVHCSPELLEYVLDLAAATRAHPEVAIGASPRATLGLLHAARAHAVLEGRGHVTPADVQAVAVASFAHRISLGAGTDIPAAAGVVAGLLAEVVVPRP